MIKILTVLGARPQFIKAANFSRVISRHSDIKEIIVHTGQHFDKNMSEVFFEQLDIPRPHYNLNISGVSHGAMTGRMLEGIEKVIGEENPDWVLVYGDTNSTLAGALAAAKLHIPVAHVEAGLRSYNPAMPEELNRLITDRISSLLLCPSQAAVANLEQEGFPFTAVTTHGGIHGLQRIHNTGDVMFDAILYYRERAKLQVGLDEFGLSHKNYILCTLHRQENTDDRRRLSGILNALREIAKETEIVLPLHPRTRRIIAQQDYSDLLTGITVLEPLPYLEMQRLQMSARIILTDSGGMQKEAYFHQVPCVTMRDESEWMETVVSGCNAIAGTKSNDIISKVSEFLAKPPTFKVSSVYGEGAAAERILECLLGTE